MCPCGRTRCRHLSNNIEPSVYTAAMRLMANYFDHLSVCLSDMTLIPAKTAEPIAMPFGMWTRLGLRNHVLDGVPDSHTRRGNFEGKNGQLAHDMPEHVWRSIYSKRLGRGWHRYGTDYADWGVLDGGAHWRNLANTTEPCMYSGDAALCQIALTACYFGPISTKPQSWKLS